MGRKESNHTNKTQRPNKIEEIFSNFKGKISQKYNYWEKANKQNFN